ncbi:hypothetical protein SDC9_194733 [bioreactor metagenome]|uniref:Uncharacterized protein n=1 Tax=bioreactor metagenome TaxID=1076179 RepID=A0A645IIF9_9ZZZZ
MNRLVKSFRIVSEAGRGDQADRAGKLACFVGENIAEHVFGGDHIELGRVFDQLHGAVVDQHVGIFHLKIVFPHSVKDFSPEPRGVQNIGLVNRCKFFPSLHGKREGHPGNPLDLFFGINHAVTGQFFSLSRKGGFAFPIIKPARQFAHHDQIDALAGDIRPKRAGVLKGCK